jgi:hypothetical protein
MTKATKLVVTYQQFAEGVGRSDRMTLEASLAWHKTYVKLDSASKALWQKDFILNYVVGRLDCDMEQAEIIYAQTRSQRKHDHEKAVNSGGSRFREHISRTSSTSSKKPDVKFTPAQRKACDDALASFPAKDLPTQIKMVRAYLTSLEAK